MDNESLDRLLDALGKESLPSLPTNLESRVWREIRERRSEPKGVSGWLAGILTWGSQWRPAYAAVAVAMLIGVVMGHLGNRPATPAAAGRADNLSGDSLGLAVFSTDPPAMPSTLLARRP